jgi:hypothetical protein
MFRLRASPSTWSVNEACTVNEIARRDEPRAYYPATESPEVLLPPLRIFSGHSLFVIALGASLSAFASGACQGPEPFHRGDADAGLSGAAGSTHVPSEEPDGKGGSGQVPTGVAGSQGRGGAGGMGRGGATGVAGMGRGGATGVAGMGRGGATGVAGMGRGGATGVAGMGRGGATGTGRGGATGVAGMGRGGTTGTGRGGSVGTVDGGARDGAIDGASRGGATGTIDAGPRDGGPGTSDASSADGPVGTGPCAGLCSNPSTVRPAVASGDLGVEATCDEVIGDITHLVCGNFVAPRTLKVNNVTVSCAGGGVALPAPRNGGWCMQASAGQYSYAYFNTY